MFHRFILVLWQSHNTCFSFRFLWFLFCDPLGRQSPLDGRFSFSFFFFFNYHSVWSDRDQVTHFFISKSFTLYECFTRIFTGFSPRISSTLQNILANLSGSVVWMVSILSLISSSLSFFSAVRVFFISLARSKYLFNFFHFHFLVCRNSKIPWMISYFARVNFLYMVKF